MRVKPRFRCTICGRNEIDAREKGCGAPETRWAWAPFGFGLRGRHLVRTACPMELASWVDRFLYYRLGILRK